ncbi:hypothetical protein BO71DRAFT_426333 [Aspergillus ellipticus CBS 707.79]|uniref:Uncharacterized protein n=1 Tax=Aspergillus ellipticus CBS 707.79 TaxID=1448320 RepID=A0A319E345_9EURO|nr:hypothetical protein BO71DRAFT_426333 [Aspergillus ellipticus CBS 707.79]
MQANDRLYLRAVRISVQDHWDGYALPIPHTSDNIGRGGKEEIGKIMYVWSEKHCETMVQKPRISLTPYAGGYLSDFPLGRNDFKLEEDDPSRLSFLISLSGPLTRVPLDDACSLLQPRLLPKTLCTAESFDSSFSVLTPDMRSRGWDQHMRAGDTGPVESRCDILPGPSMTMYPSMPVQLSTDCTEVAGRQASSGCNVLGAAPEWDCHGGFIVTLFSRTSLAQPCRRGTVGARFDWSSIQLGFVVLRIAQGVSRHALAP